MSMVFNTVKNILLLVIAVAFLRCEIAAENGENRYFELVGSADSAINENRFQDAENLLLEAMRVQPSNPSNVLLMSNLAMVRFYMGQDSLALATINDAHQLAPASVTILSNRARIYSSMVIAPRLSHGIIALYNGMIDVAERDFKMLQRVAPDSEEASIGMAMFHTSLNQFKEAIPYYSKLIEKAPVIEYYTGRINCYLELQYLSDASADIADAMKLYPDDMELYLLRGWLNRLYFRNDDAEEDFKRAMQLGATPAQVKVFKEK